MLLEKSKSDFPYFIAIVVVKVRCASLSSMPVTLEGFALNVLCQPFSTIGNADTVDLPT